MALVGYGPLVMESIGEDGARRGQFGSSPSSVMLGLTQWSTVLPSGRSTSKPHYPSCSMLLNIRR